MCQAQYFLDQKNGLKVPPCPSVGGGRTTQIEYEAKRNVRFGLKCAFFFVIHTVSQSTLALDCETVECREKRLKAKRLINLLSLKAELCSCFGLDLVLRYFYL